MTPDMPRSVTIKCGNMTFTMSGPAAEGLTLADCLAELEAMLRAWGYSFVGELDIVKPE